VDDLVLANHILSNEGVLDAFGHVSARHPTTPDRFLISQTRAPELVEAGDLQLLDLRGARVAGAEGRPYEEVAIHAAVYRERSDVGAVVHSHAPSVIPFGVTGVPLRPIYHMGSVIDMRSRCGTSRNASARPIYSCAPPRRPTISPRRWAGGPPC